MVCQIIFVFVTIQLQLCVFEICVMCTLTLLVSKCFALLFYCVCVGFGLLHFVWQFTASPHVLFSLLIGRPVLVLGSVYSEKQIRAIVNALWTFVPGHLR